MKPLKFLERKFFNRHFFLEALEQADHPLDFVADLIQEWNDDYNPGPTCPECCGEYVAYTRDECFECSSCNHTWTN